VATSNATVDDVRVALKPFTTDLSDSEIEFHIEQATQIVNGKIGKDYTLSNEPTAVKHAIILYAVYLIISNVFFDETLTTVSWRFNDIEIEHAQNAFAIRDFALKKLELADVIISGLGSTYTSVISYKTWETKQAGRPEDYYYEEESVNTE